MAPEGTSAIAEGEDVADALRGGYPGLSESYHAARRHEAASDPIGGESVDDRTTRGADFGNSDRYEVVQTLLHQGAVKDKPSLKVIQREGDVLTQERIIDEQGRSNRRPWGDKRDRRNREA